MIHFPKSTSMSQFMSTYEMRLLNVCILEKVYRHAIPHYEVCIMYPKNKCIYLHSHTYSHVLNLELESRRRDVEVPKNQDARVKG